MINPMRQLFTMSIAAIVVWIVGVVVWIFTMKCFHCSFRELDTAMKCIAALIASCCFCYAIRQNRIDTTT